MTPAMYMALVPITAFERLLFATGIAGSYIAINTILDKLIKKFKWRISTDVLHIDRNYSLSKWLFRWHA